MFNLNVLNVCGQKVRQTGHCYKSKNRAENSSNLKVFYEDDKLESYKSSIAKTYGGRKVS
ncbi:CLUMA_CG011603, isoform A [Clunio marinus]|uniref:CLUMA_CG011603, isoform A n=1 Tax=Clunio marinus TaxID=568069 RepID=A0A1J1IIF7_9DIPT|nr:CLUMA_CG011603, isoform A [Clunio marinus]